MFIIYRSSFFFHQTVKQNNFSSAGVISSKNYPANYPNKNRRTQRIKVGKGNTVILKFTAFDVEPGGPKCNYDHLSIADGDGTVLMGRACGKSGSLVIGGKKVKSALPPAVRSRSNKVSVKFVTDDSGVRSGWSLTWQEVKVTPDTGESHTLVFLELCDEKGQ